MSRVQSLRNRDLLRRAVSRPLYDRNTTSLSPGVQIVILDRWQAMRVLKPTPSTMIDYQLSKVFAKILMILLKTFMIRCNFIKASHYNLLPLKIR